MKNLVHSFKPISDRNSLVLILGTMPGPVALQRKEYYGFPGNHFWRIMSDMFGVRKELSYSEKIALLKEQRIALWDVLYSCKRRGASDSSMTACLPNDIPGFLKKHPSIRAIFLNSRGCEKIFLKHFEGKITLPYFYLPSTSPAHASLSYAQKFERWQALKTYLTKARPWC